MPPRPLPTPARGVSAGGCRLPRRAGPLTSRWCCGRPIPGAAGPRRTAPGPARPRRSQPSVAGPGSGTGALRAAGPGRKGDRGGPRRRGGGAGRTRCVSRSSPAAGVREPGACPRSGCWRERMPGSGGHSLRWAVAPGMLGSRHRSRARCHRPAPSVENRGRLHLCRAPSPGRPAPGPPRRQRPRAGPGTGDIVGSVEPCCPWHPRRGRFHSGRRRRRRPPPFLAAEPRDRRERPDSPCAGRPSRWLRTGRGERAPPGLRAAGGSEPRCARRVPRSRQRSAPGASPSTARPSSARGELSPRIVLFFFRGD